jgi:hypothetical protein
MAVPMTQDTSGLRRARWRLPAAHVELLVAALQSSARTRVTSEQRAAIRVICQAPEKALYAPEDFVIAFKLALVEAADTARVPPGPERNDLLAALVSICIDEFYRAPGINNGVMATDPQEIAPGH